MVTQKDIDTLTGELLAAAEHEAECLARVFKGQTLTLEQRTALLGELAQTVSAPMEQLVKASARVVELSGMLAALHSQRLEEARDG